MGVSQNGWFISCKILLKSDDLGVPPFQETSYSFFMGMDQYLLIPFLGG